MNNQIFLLLGTNLGDRKINLQLAIDEIEKSVGIIESKSSVYQTAAWGKLDQPEFHNQVIQTDTRLSAIELLETILSIESKLGRERKEKWGERLIDIDILLMGDTVIQTERLTIPHPQLANRKFTLVPLVEIAPNFVHPILQKTIKELLVVCNDLLAVQKLN